MQTVIVRAVPGAEASVQRAVENLGGTVGQHLGIINGFTAEVPTNHVPWLSQNGQVNEVTPDAKGHLMGKDDGKPDPKATGTTKFDMGAPDGVAKQINSGDAKDATGAVMTGAGVDVALIDSGVTPVPALAGANKVVNGPDLSMDSQSPSLANLDGYGHGTHMAGLIAGNDDNFTGVAPGARVVNVKVGAHDGAVDVSQVIAAIDWVVQHRNDNGMNIRVLNLSYGTDSDQSYVTDPLAYAAEVAWRYGIVVVVASGNDGGAAPHMADPAIDPFVIAVGASDSNGTTGSGDDTIADFSTRGNQKRHIDVLAPGVSVQSLRDPGSEIDDQNPTARVGDELFKGSGTSQAAAITSGAVALLLQSRPDLTPDQVKALLTSTDRNAHVPSLKDVGVIDVHHALTAPVPPHATQSFDPAVGTGSLEAARGSSHLVDPISGQQLTGEKDVMGNRFNAALVAADEADGSAWHDGGVFNGSRWTGSRWTDAGWEGSRWTGTSWTGSRWTSYDFSGNSWDGSRWTGSRWTGSRWTGSRWTGSRWTDAGWAGSEWA